MLKNLLFVNVGAGNVVQANRVLAVIRPSSVTAKKYIKIARDSKKYIDATNKMPSRSVILLDEGSVMISSVKPLTLLRRLCAEESMEESVRNDPAANEEESVMLPFDEDMEEEADEDCGAISEDPEA